MARVLRVEFVDPALGRPLDPAGIAATIREADRRLALAARYDSVAVAFVDAAEIRALKRDWLGVDRETDVLSFPAAPPPAPEMPRSLGDIVLCPEYLTLRYRGPAVPRRARQLALHGLLHLIGFDHEADAGEMGKLETRLRRAIGIG